MTTWIKLHPIITLLAIVVIITIVNLVIFVPKYVTERRQLTAAQLQHDAQELDHVAESASDIAQKLAQSSGDQSDRQADLEDLISQTDIIILHLQSAPHPDNLDDTADQTLQLAQIMSFGMRDMKLASNNQLKAAKTAQVMHQAAISAQSLAEDAGKE